MEIEQLLQQLQSDDDWVAIRAATQLKSFPDKRAIPHLLREIRYETRQADYVRLAREAMERGDIRGAIAIAEHLEGDAIRLRIECVRALGNIKDPSVVPNLIKIIANDEDDPYVQHEVLEALKQINSPEAL